MSQTRPDDSPSTDTNTSAEADAEKYEYVTLAPDGSRACAYCRKMFTGKSHLSVRAHLSTCPQYDRTRAWKRGSGPGSGSRPSAAEASEFQFDKGTGDSQAVADGSGEGASDSSDGSSNDGDHGRARRVEQRLGEWTDDIAAIGVLAVFYGMWIWMHLAEMPHAIVDQVAVGGAIAALGYIFGKRAVRGAFDSYSNRRS